MQESPHHEHSFEFRILSKADYEYEGSELTLFAAANNWKNYWSRQIRPYIHGTVLEVGAGLGTNTALLADQGDPWICLEPDLHMSNVIRDAVAVGRLPKHCQAIIGTLASLDPEVKADTILYIDVMEHIASDRQEMADAAARLRPGGHLIVLSPAHQWLFSPFDEAIGHYRRYTKDSLLAITPPGLKPVKTRYLDSCGLMASAANRWLLSASMPNSQQIRFWDNVLVRMSRAADPVVGFKVGKTVVGIWRRE
jgi:2-polyprenyl-3-methyl-5-hydroxy-6-metoxy-1,4-benzoquinol methylase